MKLELDFADRPSVCAKHKELKLILVVLEAAIRTFPNDDSKKPLAEPSTPPSEGIFNDIPMEFRISDLMSCGLNRPAARRLMDEWVEKGIAKLLERKRGAAGSVYQKSQ